MKPFPSVALLAVSALFWRSGAFLHQTMTIRRSLSSLPPAASVDQDVADWLDTVAQKLRLQVYDLDTGVYGLESKDPDFGIEVIRTFLHISDGDDSLGLELTEVAHGRSDHRGLVLVSAILEEEVAKNKPIHVGDTIVGVFVGENFKESTTDMDYDDTVDVLSRAKEYAKSVGGSTISLELNRLVKRATIHVIVEDETGHDAVKFDAKAGDNLRSLLMHHHASLYGNGKAALHRLDQPTLTNDCGGEGICGTCLVKINEGMSHLNAIGPQEYSILQGRPESWRASCKTVVGADNEEGSTLRIRLHPWIPSEADARLQM
ncbi:ferredoxin [Nitzschia inconspicua]|uniref:Ferredoxin n=1 Tax=Nitzschia inconspicua TaxID=303405 RepID=A0A9K3PT47_9STRA|nr:ferredoxin [Nitzschia inconspicua]